MELSQRKGIILAAVVEQFIQTGEPVGSKALMAKLPISVSSATIRNEMSDLVLLGLLAQPHTSAGRVPTQEGYRYYIDNLMQSAELPENEKSAIMAELRRAGDDPNKLLEKANEILARKSDCAALTTSPADVSAVIERIEIIPISTRTAMIVLITSSGIIKSSICRTDYELDESMIDLFKSICKKEFVGKAVTDIDTVMIQTIVAGLGMNALLMSSLFVTLSQIAGKAAQAEVHLKGEQNLLHHSELFDSVFSLMQFLNDGDKLSRAVDLNKRQMNVNIGNENDFLPLEKASMIVCRYTIHGRDGGALGVIGPTRLDYARLIPSIKFLAEAVSELMNDSFGKI